jgi:glycerophosphoryl diester phosphodiesterase
MRSSVRRRGESRPPGRLVALLAAVCLGAAAHYGLYRLFRGPAPAYRHVIAHRGASAHAPENTLAAFRAALAAGADWLEMDVQRTKDGRLIVFHDATVDRMTDGTGRAADLTFDEIRTLRVGAGERVAAFEEVIRLAASTGARILPEAKDPALTAGLARDMLAAVAQEGLAA